MTLNAPRFFLVLPIFLVSSLLVIWHYDFDRLGSVPFGTRSAAFSLFFNRTFAIDEFKDNAGVDFAFFNGHYYSGYPPLVPIITAGFLAIEQVFVYAHTRVLGHINGHIAWGLESWFIALPQILSLCGLSWLLFGLLRYMGRSYRLAYFVGWLLPFTSYALVYSVGANNDLPAAFLIFWGFYLLATGTSPQRAFLAGFVVSLAGLAQYPAILYLLSFGGLVVYQLLLVDKSKKLLIKGLFIYLLGASLPILALAVYHTLLFGAPWRFAHFYHAIPVAPGQTAANKVDFSIFNIPDGLRGLLISPLKGLFVYAPLTVFSFFGWQRLFRQHRVITIGGVLSIVLIVLFYAVWWDWSGGFDFASRYLISTLPFFYLGLAFALPTIFRRLWLKLAFLGAIVWSFLTTIVFTFTGIREAVRMEKWMQWGALGRFESFFEVFTKNDPKDVAPIIIRFANEWPLIGGLPYSVVGFMLFGAVLVLAILPLLVVLTVDGRRWKVGVDDRK
jgi:hypothetical protein